MPMYFVIIRFNFRFTIVHQEITLIRSDHSRIGSSMQVFKPTAQRRFGICSEILCSGTKFLLGVLLAACLAVAQTPHRTVAQEIVRWRPHDISFNAESRYEWDAFPMQVTFSHSAGRSLTLDAYWSGDRTWIVRFACPLAGTWTYASSSADAGLDSATGMIQCREPRPDALQRNPNLRGKLRVADGDRSFGYADGTPFLGLAEEFWDFNVSSWMPLKNLDAYLSDRSAKGFNIVQIRYLRITEPNEGGYPFDDNRSGGIGTGSFEELNASYFRFLDRRFEVVFEAGFVVAGHPEWIGRDVDITVADAKALHRYLMARYGAYNVLWSLSGEFDKNFHDEHRYTDHVEGRWNSGGAYDPEADPEPWRELGRFIADHNPYGTPLSVHPGWARDDRHSSGDYLHEESWLDHNWIQTYNNLHLVPSSVREDYERHPPKPVFFAEGIREGDQTEEIEVGAYGVRWEAWQAYLSGAAIHTYRHFGVYMGQWHAQGLTGTVLENLDAPGSSHVGHAAAFFRDLPWWRMEPTREAVRVDGGVPPYPSERSHRELDKAITMAAAPGEIYVIYIPMNSVGKTISIRSLDGKAYKARWFNPRSGSFEGVEVDGPAEGGEHWTLPARPNRMDWVLLLR